MADFSEVSYTHTRVGSQTKQPCSTPCSAHIRHFRFPKERHEEELEVDRVRIDSVAVLLVGFEPVAVDILRNQAFPRRELPLLNIPRCLLPRMPGRQDEGPLTTSAVGGAAKTPRDSSQSCRGIVRRKSPSLWIERRNQATLIIVEYGWGSSLRRRRRWLGGAIIGIEMGKSEARNGDDWKTCCSEVNHRITIILGASAAEVTNPYRPAYQGADPWIRRPSASIIPHHAAVAPPIWSARPPRICGSSCGFWFPGSRNLKNRLHYPDGGLG